MKGNQEIIRVNARLENDIKAVNRRLQEGWRILHAVGYEQDTMLVLVMEAPREFGEAR